MAKRILILITLVAAVATAFATTLATQNTAPAAPATPLATGTIQGTVTREGTVDPIADVQITITGRGYGTAPLNVQTAQSILDAINRGVTVPEELIQQAQAAIATTGTTGAAGTAAVPPPPLTATTDNNGHFSISNVPVGEANVRAQLEGYFAPAVNGQSSSMVTSQVVVTAQKTADAHLTMIPGGTISGRITDAGGKPMSDAPVMALQMFYSNGILSPQPLNLKASDDRGEYRLYRLPPGEYLLAVSPRSNPRTPGAAAPTEVPVTTLYPGVIDRALSVPIVLKGGEEMTGVNLQIKTAASAKISGKVTSALPPGQVINGRGAVREAIANVSLVPHNLDAIPDFLGGNGINGNADGTFQLTNVAPGIYDLIARMPATYGWGPQAPPERATGAWAFGRTTVEVRGSNVDDVNILVTPGVDLKGHVVVDGKPSSPNLRLTLSPADSAANSNDGPTGNIFNQISQYPARIETDGSFTFPAIPQGRYQFQAMIGATTTGARGQRGQAATTTPEPEHIKLPANAYLADIRQGGVSVYDNGLNVGTQAMVPLDVIMNTDGGSIEGSVLGADRKPVMAGMTVVLIPAEARRQNPALYKTNRTDAQGHFVMTIVPPGQYKLFAWENIPQGAWQNAEFMKAHEERGTVVNVLAGARVTVQTTLIPK